jgi:hypothetical protein
VKLGCILGFHACRVPEPDEFERKMYRMFGQFPTLRKYCKDCGQEWYMLLGTEGFGSIPAHHGRWIKEKK